MINILNEKDILDNYEKFKGIINDNFPTRAKSLISMYEDLGERVLMAPAATTNKAHNSFPGGYLEHVIRVVENSRQLYKVWVLMKMNVEGFTLEELTFAAINHDLGKLGFPGERNEYYLPETLDWRHKKGYAYKANTSIPWMSVPDCSIFLLQNYGIKMSFNEMHSIRIHDGLYDKMNETYFLNYFDNGKFQTNMPYILMQADIMAMRFEYQRTKHLLP